MCGHLGMPSRRVSAWEEGIGPMAANTGSFVWEKHFVTACEWKGGGVSHGSCWFCKLTKSSLHSRGNCANSQELVLFFLLNGLYWRVPEKRWKGRPHCAVNLQRRRISHHFLIFLWCWSKRVSWDSNKAKSTIPLIIKSQSTGVGIQPQRSGPWF